MRIVEETNFSLLNTHQEISPLLGIRSCVCFSELGTHLALNCAGPVYAAQCSLCVFICVSILLCLKSLLSLVSSIPTDSENTSVSSSTEFSEPEGRDLRDISYLVLGITSSSMLFILSSCGTLYCSHVLQETTVLMMADMLTCEYSRLSLDVILLLGSFRRTVAFGFPTGLWSIQSQVLGNQGNFKHRFCPWNRPYF